jgi:DnaK suppressor protein
MDNPISKKELLSMPNEDYMNPQQLQFFERILLKMKTDILEGFEKIKSEILPQESVSDINDIASNYELQQYEFKRADRERKLLKKINQSLSQIKSGNYGYCSETGEEIGLKRLIARPTATLCVSAKEKQEYKEKTIGIY